MIVSHRGLPLCSASVGMACTPCCVKYALQVCVCSRKWCGTQNFLTHRPLLVVPNQAQHPQDTAGAEVESTKKGLGRTNAIRPGESGVAAAAASALAPIGPSEVSSEEATVPDDGSLGGGGGRGRGGDGGSGFDDLLGKGGGGGRFDDLMGDFGLSGVDSKDAKAFLIDDAAPSNATQMALVEASALSGSLSSPRPAASPEPFTSARAGASAGDGVGAGEGFGRTPSFEGRLAERTPSDWDRSFKTEMHQAGEAGRAPGGDGEGDRIVAAGGDLGEEGGGAPAGAGGAAAGDGPGVGQGPEDGDEGAGLSMGGAFFTRCQTLTNW